MKISKILSLLVALTMLMSACAVPASDENDDDRLDIVTTNFAMYDFARAVAGDLCDVKMLIPPGTESHDFEATLADIATISKAEVFVHIGDEDWVEDIFTSMGKEADGIFVVNALEIVKEKGTEVVCDDSDEHEHEHEGHEHTLDEHCWTSIGNAVILIDEITEAIISVDETLAGEVSEKRNAYVEQLENIDSQFYELMNNAERTKIVVADRFPFAYMTARYGIDYKAAFSGCTSDTEPSLTVINSLIETVNNENIPIIFVTEGSDRKTADAVAAETGAEIMELYSAQSITKSDFENGTTYAQFMEKNLVALKTALGAE